VEPVLGNSDLIDLRLGRALVTGATTVAAFITGHLLVVDGGSTA
jgi:hypothetical protein